MIPKKLNLVIYGAGAIGATLGGWLSQDYENIYLLTRGENLEVLKRSGLRMYELDKNKTIAIPVKVIRDLNELDKIDIILITVKNYDLETVAKDISEKSEDNCIVVGLQNGVENQRVLPKYFSKVLYGVLMISAWKDQPGVFGNTGRGRIVFGSLNIDVQELTQDIANILNKSFPTRATRRIQDAVHTKLALNLANSIFTIINSTVKEDDDIYLLWKIFLKIYIELHGIIAWHNL